MNIWFLNFYAVSFVFSYDVKEQKDDKCYWDFLCILSIMLFVNVSAVTFHVTLGTEAISFCYDPELIYKIYMTNLWHWFYFRGISTHE